MAFSSQMMVQNHVDPFRKTSRRLLRSNLVVMIVTILSKFFIFRDRERRLYLLLIDSRFQSVNNFEAFIDTQMAYCSAGHADFSISSVILVGLYHLIRSLRMANGQLKTTIFINDLAGLSEYRSGENACTCVDECV